MTIDNELVLVEFAGDGVSTLFSYNFRILKNNDVKVVLQDNTGANITQTLTTDYTVEGVGVENGSVRMIVPPAADEFLSVFLEPPFQQTAVYPPGGPFPSTVHEKALDELANMAKNLLYRADRSLQRPDGDQGAVGVFDAVLRRIINLADPTGDTDAATKQYADSIVAAAVLDPTTPVTPYAVTLLDDVNAAEARTTLGGLATGIALFISATAAAAMNALGFNAFFQTLVAATSADNFLSLFYATTSEDFNLPGLMLNADHQSWQHGETFNSTTPAAGGNNDGEWISDQWVLLSDAADTVDIVREPEDTPPGARSAMKVTTVLADGQHGFAQWIEAERTISNRSKKVSLSIWLKATGDLTDFKAHIISWDGTADSPPKEIVLTWPGGAADPTMVTDVTLEGTVSIVGTSSWTEYLLPNITVPAGANNLGVFLVSNDAAFTAAQDYFWTAANLVEHLRPAKFRSRMFDDEVRDCERFFQKTFNYEVFPASNAGVVGSLTAEITTGSGNPDIAVQWQFHTRMRITPTIVTFNPSASGGAWREVGGTNGIASEVIHEGQSGCFIGGDDVGASDLYSIHATADARWA